MTPINHIIGLTTSILNDELTDKQRASIQAIWWSGERMRLLAES